MIVDGAHVGHAGASPNSHASSDPALIDSGHHEKSRKISAGRAPIGPGTFCACRRPKSARTASACRVLKHPSFWELQPCAPREYSLHHLAECRVSSRSGQPLSRLWHLGTAAPAVPRTGRRTRSQERRPRAPQAPSCQRPEPAFTHVGPTPRSAAERAGACHRGLRLLHSAFQSPSVSDRCRRRSAFQLGHERSPSSDAVI